MGRILLSVCVHAYGTMVGRSQNLHTLSVVWMNTDAGKCFEKKGFEEGLRTTSTVSHGNLILQDTCSSSGGSRLHHRPFFPGDALITR